MPESYTSRSLRKVAKKYESSTSIPLISTDISVAEKEPILGLDARVRLIVRQELARALNDIAAVREMEPGD